MKTFYIYQYYDPITNIPFYIGKGCGRRYRDIKGHSSNTHLYNKIQKLRKEQGLFVKDFTKFLHKNLDNETALRYEIELIKTLGRRDLQTGPLLNMTTGGDGVKTLAGCKLYKICDDKPNFEKMLKEGKTRKEIQTHYNCKGSLITRAARILELKFKGAKLDLDEPDVIDTYLATMSIDSTRKKFNCDRSPVIRVLEKNGIIIKDGRNFSIFRGGKGKNKLDPLTEKILDLYLNDNLSLEEISVDMGVACSTVRDLLIKNRIAISRNFSKRVKLHEEVL